MFPGDPPWGLELQIHSLAGGKTEDYVAHVTEVLYDVSNSYALFTGNSSVDIRKSVVSKVKNTISDRVSVNHCVWQQLQEALNINFVTNEL